MIKHNCINFSCIAADPACMRHLTLAKSHRAPLAEDKEAEEKESRMPTL
jgi:hypothetical protein